MTHAFAPGRRTFLQAAAAAIATLATGTWSGRASAGDAVPLKLALQGYSLKQLDLGELLTVARELGIGRLELYDDQLPVLMEDGQLRAVKQEIAGAGVTVPATYTDLFSGDRERNARILDFGERMGLQFFSCRPDHGALRLIDEQVADHDLGIALHNTSPSGAASFVYLEELETALERLPNVDACVDVGNFARARVDPVEALRRLRGRVREVHVKDVDAAGRDVVPGEGVLDLQAIVAELVESRFDGLVTLEYTGGTRELAVRKEHIATGYRRLHRWSRSAA